MIQKACATTKSVIISVYTEKMVFNQTKGSIIMSYEFMEQISDHVESRLQLERERMEFEAQKKEKQIQKMVGTIAAVFLLLLTFALETPH